ncbi:hypothetical protein PM082_023742 [Marasmius tenuissimus]|nr:hypothetical protein PM082_023742 [Marasmius tenuissimus]
MTQGWGVGSPRDMKFRVRMLQHAEDDVRSQWVSHRSRFLRGDRRKNRQRSQQSEKSEVFCCERKLSKRTVGSTLHWHADYCVEEIPENKVEGCCPGQDEQPKEMVGDSHPSHRTYPTIKLRGQATSFLRVSNGVQVDFFQMARFGPQSDYDNVIGTASSEADNGIVSKPHNDKKL